MTLVPSNTEGESTRITFLELELDIPVDDKTFSLQALKR
jgi:hypothetical protein